MKANKADIEIDDREGHLYHVKLVEQHRYDNGKVDTSTRIQKFTEPGFQGFLKHKSMFGFVSEEILHDPTVEQTVKKPRKSNPSQT